MAGLTWSGDEGFDTSGRRVASVLPGTDNLAAHAVQGGAGYVGLRRFWEAYVAHDGRFEVVMVGDRPGRWPDADAARAAATAAYTAWLATASSDPSRTPQDADAGVFSPEEPDGGRTATRVLGTVRDILRACLIVRRPGRRPPAPSR